MFKESSPGKIRATTYLRRSGIYACGLIGENRASNCFAPSSSSGLQMIRTTLFVTSNADSGAGSLRAALERTQRTRGAYDIVFEGSSRGTNDLGTGYFTIQLESPLPDLFQGDIRINVVSPRAVTILPRSAAGGVNASRPRPLTTREEGGVSPSMLTVGDVGHLDVVRLSSTSSRIPNDVDVEINGVSFVRNQARGGDGERGGGGGLGAGGAIAFLEGTLKITNSVFQDLNARGGFGGAFAGGGNGSLMSGTVVTQRNSDGEAGGNGGISSIPLVRNNDGTMAYNRSATGGKGGGKGREYGVLDAGGGTFLNGREGLPGGTARINTRLAISSARLFGYGGGGGGGGGGRGRKIGTRVTYGSPGQGGAGGLAGQFGGNGGRGGLGGTPNPGSGINGEGGFAIGGAIASIDPTPNLPSDPRFPLNQNLILENVDFYNVSSTAQDSNRIIGGILAAPRGNRGDAVVNDVYFGSGSLDKRLLNPDAPQAEFSGDYRAASTIEDPFPFQDGLSSPRSPDVAQTRDVVLQGKSGFSDNFLIRYESGSSTLGIATDLTDPNNPIGRIWSNLVPDEEQSILDEYYSAANANYWKTVFTKDKLKDFAWDLGKKALGLALKKAGLGELSTVVAGAAAGIAKDSITYFNSLANRANQLDADLDANAEAQKQLQSYLAEASGSAQIGQVNVGLQRSEVNVLGFELGKDTLVIPSGEGAAENLRFRFSEARRSTSTPGTIGIEFQYSGGRTGSTELPFLYLELDRQTSEIIRTREIPVIQYLNRMLSLSEDGRSWVIGPKLNDAVISDITSWVGGPASTTVAVNRPNTAPLGLQFSVNTSLGDDVVYGTDGNESIITGAGNDMIFPAFGSDSVIAGAGTDLVSYVADGRVLRFQGSENGSIRVSAPAGGGDFVSSELIGIEGLHGFGSSQFDLSTISRPENGLFGVITGSGSQITGSLFDDVLEVSYFSDYNDESVSPYLASSVVDGGAGFNSLRLNLEEARDPLSFSFADDGRAVQITSSPLNGTEIQLVIAYNIDLFDIVLGSQVQDLDLGQIESEDALVPMFRMIEPADGLVPMFRIHAGAGADHLVGDEGSNQFYGDAGNDSLDGGAGNDKLIGGLGNDVLFGGDDCDYLVADQGVDVLTGGRDADSFHIQVGSQSTIVDFDSQDGDLIVLDLVSEVNFSVAKNRRQLNKSTKNGSSNFVYFENKNCAYWSADGQKDYQIINFGSRVSSADLENSVLGWVEGLDAGTFAMA